MGRTLVAAGAFSTSPVLLRRTSALAQSRELGLASAVTSSGPPKFVCTDFSRRFDPAYLSNGLIGIRPGPNPLAHALTLVSGFVFEHIPYRMECLSPAPDPLRSAIRLNGLSLLEHPGLLQVKRQELDMATGELLTDMLFTAADVNLQIQVLQFASRSVPSLLCQQIRVVPSSTVDIELVAGISTEGVPGRAYATRPPERTDIDLAVGFESHGSLSRLGAAISLLTPDGPARRDDPINTPDGATRTYHLSAKAAEPLRVRTVAALVSQFYQPEPDLEAIRLALWGAGLGFDVLRARNREIWGDLWKSRVKVSGDTDDQRLLDAAFFYLHSSVHPSTETGMAPFGLSQSEHYYGHSFWDTETWSLAPITLASPETARSLVEYRVRGLPAARRLAALSGYRGAQFPWEAGEIDGSEVTPTFASSGVVEQHITPDVALGFWEYQLATGDADFLRDAAWPVLKAVAEWIESRGVRTRRGFEIQHIMGPDEGVADTTNNAYVNLICKMVIAAALDCAAELRATPPASWQRIHDTLVIPLDTARGIVLPYDDARPGPNYSLRSLDLLVVHDPPLTLDLLRRTHDYEKTVSGSGWARLGFAVAAGAAAAAMLGDRSEARRLFDDSWKDVWLEPYGMIREASSQDYGCFLTNFGSILQTAMLGFTGLRIRPGDWRAYPAVLPEGWSRIEIDRLWIRGEPKRVIAENGSKARLLD